MYNHYNYKFLKSIIRPLGMNPLQEALKYSRLKSGKHKIRIDDKDYIVEKPISRAKHSQSYNIKMDFGQFA